MSFFLPSAKLQIILFSTLYGSEQSDESNKAIGELIWFRDKRPGLPAVSFLAGRRNRICYEYTEAERAGVRPTMRMLPGWANRDTMESLSHSPYRHSRKRLWRWPNVFSVSAANGMWMGRILPELYGQQESSRISGSSSLRATNTIIAAPPPSKGNRIQGKKSKRE